MQSERQAVNITEVSETRITPEGVEQTDVTLVERYNCLGGLSTGGLVMWIDRMTDWQGEHVIQGFARRVGSERRLTALYLLTVADIRGTSPKVWNGWKAKLLEDLFWATRRVVAGDHVDTH